MRETPSAACSAGTGAKERRRLFSPPSIMKSGPATKETPVAFRLGQQRRRCRCPRRGRARGSSRPRGRRTRPRGSARRSAATSASQRAFSSPLTNSMLRSSAPERAELEHDRLGQHVRRDVGLVGPLGELRDLLRGPGQVADADAGADRLGEGGGVDHLAGAVELQHRLQRLALEGQLAVGVVLEDPEVVLGGELDQPPPLLDRERAAGGVVGVGDDVGELDRPRRRAPPRRPPRSSPSASSGTGTSSTPSRCSSSSVRS